MSKPVAAAFNQGELSTIVCINAASTPFPQWQCGPSFAGLVAVLQKWCDVFANVWHIPAKLVVGTRPVPGCWACVFTDDADEANALGYHEATADGWPVLKNFVRTSLSSGNAPSVTASHELGEALADPCVNLCAVGPRNVIYAYEVCDAVEAFSFKIDGISVSDFQYPAWFENYRRPKYDHMGLCTRPFQILRGGYMPVMKNGRWTQIFGAGGEKRFREMEPRRSVMRGKPLRKSRV